MNLTGLFKNKFFFFINFIETNDLKNKVRFEIELIKTVIIYKE
jgi:hypothetical protein